MLSARHARHARKRGARKKEQGERRGNGLIHEGHEATRSILPVIPLIPVVKNSFLVQEFRVCMGRDSFMRQDLQDFRILVLNLVHLVNLVYSFPSVVLPVHFCSRHTEKAVTCVTCVTRRGKEEPGERNKAKEREKWGRKWAQHATLVRDSSLRSE